MLASTFVPTLSGTPGRSGAESSAHAQRADAPLPPFGQAVDRVGAHPPPATTPRTPRETIPLFLVVTPPPLPPMPKPSFYSRSGKRCLDLFCAASALLLLSPVLVIAALLVRWRLGAPIFFRHRRPGRDGVPFVLLKFRSMIDARDATGQLLPDEARQTRLGNFLRDSSLDELPELLNVLRGEMSLVGPRPLLVEYLSLYTPEQSRRHEVRPGMTGWAQINGRNLISWEEKFRLDVWYVENHSLRLDLQILLATLRKVIRREGISAPSHFSSPEFDPRAGK